MKLTGLQSFLVAACFATQLLSHPSWLEAQAGNVDLQDLLGGTKSLRSKTPKAKFSTKLSAVTVRPGEEITLSVIAEIPDDYYIYGLDGKVKTEIAVKATGAVAVGSGFTPDDPGKTSFSADFDGDITKHYGVVTWSQTYRVLDDASAVQFTGSLKGQYCSNPDAGGQCIPILPPFQIDQSAKVMRTTSSSMEYRIRPARQGVDGEQPDPIEYEFRLEPADAVEGDIVTLSVTARINEGWHTYSLSQTGIGAAPTEIDVHTRHNLEPQGDGFEADRPFVLQENDIGRLEEYYGEVTWTRSYLVTAVDAGDYGLAGDLTYAVCDERSCKPVKSVEFAVGSLPAADMVVADIGAEPISPFAAVSEEPNAVSGEGVRAAAETRAFLDGGQVGDVAALDKDQSLIPFLLLCIGGGFLALLTPCSFPMVPITVSFFLKQSEQNHRRPWLLALVYCGSIVLAFTVLGVGIAAIFGATKLNELANNPWINLVIAAVFVAFGLNMLGAFEIRIPTSLLTWSAMHEGGGSYLGAVFMALTFTLTSFTCTFAVAGSLLVMAAQGAVYWPVIGMLAFGAAFASPFFILALLPGLLKKLPKSGGWMNSVKVVLGLIEIGAAVKFFSVADLAWNPQPVVFDYVTTMMIWLVLSLAIGAYLLGWYRLSHDTAIDSVSTGRGLLAMSFLGLALMLGYLILQPERAEGLLMDQIVAFAPPRLHGAETELGPTIEHHGILFALDLDQAKPVAQRRDKPLLLDFTGVNCVNCRRMEKKMQQPENRQRMEQFVNVQLYADKVPAVTNPEQAESLLQKNRDLQINWFGDVALPSYAIVSPDGERILAAYIGYEEKEGEFTRFLDFGWKRWEDHQASAELGAPLNVVNR